MKRIPVKSSDIASVGYDEQTLTLEVEFKDKSIYQYTKVPKYVYLELISADSKVEYFSRYIRDNVLYGCTRIFPTVKWRRF